MTFDFVPESELGTACSLEVWAECNATNDVIELYQSMGLENVISITDFIRSGLYTCPRSEIFYPIDIFLHTGTEAVKFQIIPDAFWYQRLCVDVAKAIAQETKTAEKYFDLYFHSERIDKMKIEELRLKPKYSIEARLVPSSPPREPVEKIHAKKNRELIHAGEKKLEGVKDRFATILTDKMMKSKRNHVPSVLTLMSNVNDLKPLIGQVLREPALYDSKSPSAYLSFAKEYSIGSFNDLSHDLAVRIACSCSARQAASIDKKKKIKLPATEPVLASIGKSLQGRHCDTDYCKQQIICHLKKEHFWQRWFNKCRRTIYCIVNKTDPRTLQYEAFKPDVEVPLVYDDRENERNINDISSSDSDDEVDSEFVQTKYTDSGSSSKSWDSVPSSSFSAVNDPAWSGIGDKLSTSKTNSTHLRVFHLLPELKTTKVEISLAPAGSKSEGQTVISNLGYGIKTDKYAKVSVTRQQFTLYVKDNTTKRVLGSRDVDLKFGGKTSVYLVPGEYNSSNFHIVPLEDATNTAILSKKPMLKVVNACRDYNYLDVYNSGDFWFNRVPFVGSADMVNNWDQHVPVGVLDRAGSYAITVTKENAPNSIVMSETVNSSVGSETTIIIYGNISKSDTSGLKYTVVDSSERSVPTVSTSRSAPKASVTKKAVPMPKLKPIASEALSKKAKSTSTVTDLESGNSQFFAMLEATNLVRQASVGAGSSKHVYVFVPEDMDSVFEQFRNQGLTDQTIIQQNYISVQPAGKTLESGFETINGKRLWKLKRGSSDFEVAPGKSAVKLLSPKPIVKDNVYYFHVSNLHTNLPSPHSK